MVRSLDPKAHVLKAHDKFNTHPQATVTAMGLEAIGQLQHGRALLWAYAASYRKNWVACSFLASLLGYLHVLFLYIMISIRVLKPP